jgi:hypothetical protein
VKRNTSSVEVVFTTPQMATSTYYYLVYILLWLKTGSVCEAAKMENRGNRSVREVSRDQYDIDKRNGYTGKITNRMSWARNPKKDPDRGIAK